MIWLAFALALFLAACSITTTGSTVNIDPTFELALPAIP